MKPDDLLRIIHDADPSPVRCKDGYIWAHFGDKMLTLNWSGDDGSHQEESWKLIYQRELSQNVPA